MFYTDYSWDGGQKNKNFYRDIYYDIKHKRKYAILSKLFWLGNTSQATKIFEKELKIYGNKYWF